MEYKSSINTELADAINGKFEVVNTGLAMGVTQEALKLLREEANTLRRMGRRNSAARIDASVRALTKVFMALTGSNVEE
jgi:hypothetical protein